MMATSSDTIGYCYIHTRMREMQAIHPFLQKTNKIVRHSVRPNAVFYANVIATGQRRRHSGERIAVR